MVIVPNSDIILLKSPLKLDKYNEITFPNKASQYAYFNGLPKLVYDDCTYQRKDGVIRYATNGNLTFEDLLEYNYCMYRNTNYDSKWFYAFVTDVTYINDGMTEVKIDTDAFQTWQFDLEYKNSFIEREHVSDDTIGAHTLPEQLETGEFVCNGIGNLWTQGKNCWVAAMVTVIPEGLEVNSFHVRYGGVFSGGCILVFLDWLSACNFTRAYDLVDKAEAITSIFMIPKSLCGNITREDFTLCEMKKGVQTIQFMAAVPPYTDQETLLSNVSVTSPSTLNGYTPRNNKLFTYPYNYFYVSNTVGTDAEFHYEDFVNNSPSFKTVGTLTIGASIRCVPINYKKLSDTNTSYNHFNCGISGAKYPVCSWTNDSFTNWLTEQSVNNTMAIMGGAAGIVGGTALALSGVGTVAGVGLVGGGIASIVQTLKDIHQHSLIPPQTKGNTNTGDVAFASGSFEFPYYKMSLRYEYAKVIDDYFTMYGYKVNSLKTPNIHKRSNWDYIKTIDVNLEGNIPEKDLDTIRGLFNEGCTFWHTTTHYLDYSQTNSII